MDKDQRVKRKKEVASTAHSHLKAREALLSKGIPNYGAFISKPKEEKKPEVRPPTASNVEMPWSRGKKSKKIVYHLPP